MQVNIKGIERQDVLKVLWENSFPARFFNMNGMRPPPFDIDEAKKFSLDRVDYLCGRPIKTNMGSDTIDLTAYMSEIKSYGSLQSFTDIENKINGLR